MHAAELGPLRWVKSSHSTNNGACVEVARGTQHVAVRDSKHPDGPVLLFPAPTFRHFTRTR